MQAAQHLSQVAVAAAQLQWADLVGVIHLNKHHGPVPEGLQGAVVNHQGGLHRFHHDIPGHQQTGGQQSLGIVNFNPGQGVGRVAGCRQQVADGAFPVNAVSLQSDFLANGNLGPLAGEDLEFGPQSGQIGNGE